MVAETPAPSSPTIIVGHWRVVGCETSPKDPADCARGQIVFTSDRVTIDVPSAAQRTTHAYTVVSSSTDHVVVNIAGDVSEIKLDPSGAAARWRVPGLGGRVGQLSFVRTEANP